MDLTGITVDTVGPLAAGAIVVAGTAAIWGIKRIQAIFGR